MTFERAYAMVNGSEGGLSDRKADRGGHTFRGITQLVYSAFRKGGGQDDQDVILMTDAEHYTICYTGYWKRAHCGDLRENIGILVYDMAFNSGPSMAIKLLQRASGAEDDGAWGPETERKASAGPEHALLVEYFAARRRFYAAIIANDPHKNDPERSQANNKNGWENRLLKLEAVWL